MSDQLDLSTLPPEVQSVLGREDVQALLNSTIDKAKAPLLTKRDELLGQLTTAKQTLQQVQDLGGLEALTAAQQARADADAAKRAAEIAEAEKNGNAEQLKKHYSDQLSAKDQELQSLRQLMIDEKVSSKLGREIREAKGTPELLEPHLKNRIKAELKDGKVQITVLTPSGMPMLKDDGKEATIADLIAELKASPIYQRAFEAPSVSGAGSRPSQTPGANNPWAPNTFNITQQMQLFRQDPAAARRMAAEYGKTI